MQIVILFAFLTNYTFLINFKLSREFPYIIPPTDDFKTLLSLQRLLPPHQDCRISLRVYK